MTATLEARLKRIMLFRVVMVTTLLFIATYVVGAMFETLPAVNPLYFVIGGTYALTVLYALALRFFGRWTGQVYVQMVGDLLIITALVYATGGVALGTTVLRTGFLLLYPISVLSATVLLPRRGVLTLSGLATALYGGLLLAARTGLVSAPGLADVVAVPARAALYSIFVLGVACSTVAVLGSYLNESLQHAGRQLRDAAVEVADLRELNQLIVDSIQSGLLSTDAHARVLHVNPVGEQLLGRSAASLRGVTVAEAFSSPLLVEGELRARAGSRELARLELSYLRPDGRRLEIGVSANPLTRGGQAAGGFLLVFQDLTDIRRLEEEVRTKEKLAAVGEMAAQLAHEIRNPLGSIRGSAQVLMGEEGIGEEQARLLSIISRESKRLSDTLNRFLYQARQPARPRQPVDLRPVLESAVTLLRNAAEVGPDHQVSFEADEGPHVCLADADEITQVFWNLVRNALEAMPAGGRLDIGLRHTARDVVISVRDQGRGLARDSRALPFGPLPARSGAGLGLAIVFRIVRQHGGDLTVRSDPGRGTEFDVRLPLALKAAS